LRCGDGSAAHRLSFLLQLPSAAEEWLNCCWRQRQLHRAGAITSQNVLLVTVEND
jgi:hypothetical protein